VVLAHERLAIVDVLSGSQPLRSAATGVTLAVNGEIYNHRELRASLRDEHEFQTDSDCEVILYLYEELGPACVELLDGIFAFVLWDPRAERLLVARDHIGIVPLYWGRDEHGVRYVASEMKAIADVCSDLEVFPPGHFYSSGGDRLHRYYDPEWRDPGFDAFEPFDRERLRATLEENVRRQMMSDVPYGVLISGGIDSSIIAALAARHRKGRIETNEQREAWWPSLHSYCIGLPGAPDLAAAQKVADHLGTVHHAFEYTIQEGLDALSDAIYHLETFDITTIRAGTPMFLMARKIKSMGVKMVLSGEGADETLAGYLYFHKAPNADELRQETLRKLFALHKYDCLRANKAMAGWGVEARVPYLAREVLDLVMAMDPIDKMCTPERIEKWSLRTAFDGYIPGEVLWRQKEQFSDGVGYSWIDTLRARAEAAVSDEMMAAAGERYPVKTPLNKEGYWYRTFFESHFPSQQAAACVQAEPSIACSTETALRWDAEFRGRADPSGRAVAQVHEKAY
jgi:asparagine synthase (glutamine-hydrolysing)